MTDLLENLAIVTLPGMRVDERALLELHRIQVQNALHTQGVSA